MGTRLHISTKTILTASDSEFVKVETDVKTDGESGSHAILAEEQLELTDIGGAAGK